jgi:hypothetical protein
MTSFVVYFASACPLIGKESDKQTREGSAGALKWYERVTQEKEMISHSTLSVFAV